MPHSKSNNKNGPKIPLSIKQNNVNGPNNVTFVIPQRSKLGNTIDKIMESRHNFIPKPLGVVCPPDVKIPLNKVSNRWKKIIDNVTPLFHAIEDLCNKAENHLYDNQTLIQLFADDYQTDYQTEFKKGNITADQVLDGLVDFYINSFEKRNIYEEHDRHELPKIVAYAFINCGVLETK